MKRIIVHPGVFHADDALCVALAKKYFGVEEVVRANPTQEDLDDPNIIVADVGGVYDIAKNNYDHHQDRELPAACKLMADALELHSNCSIHSRVVEQLIIPISDVDTGKTNLPGNLNSLSAVVHALNSYKAKERAFHTAVTIMGAALDAAIAAAEEWHRAYNIVVSAEAANNDSVLVLSEYVSWQEHISERDDVDKLYYVIYPSLRGGYSVFQVPKELPYGREGKKSFPEKIAGKRGVELASVLEKHGLKLESPDAPSVFCHPGRFCAGAETLTDALKIAQYALGT